MARESWAIDCKWIKSRECPHLMMDDTGSISIRSDEMCKHFSVSEVCLCCLKGLELELNRRR